MVLLEVTGLGGKEVKRAVSLAHTTDGTTKDEGAVGTGVTTRFIDISNAELDRSVILGGDKTTSGRAKKDV